MALKSPDMTAAVGTQLVVWGGSDRTMVPCIPPKKNSLSRRIWPPKVPPHWFRFRVSCRKEKVLRAFTSPLRMNSKRLPCQSLDPDLVTALTTAPGCVP